MFNLISHFTGENTFAAEKKAFQEEIDALRQESSRIKELENENRNLKAKLTAQKEDSQGSDGTHGRKLDDPSHGYPGADGTELAKAQGRLKELKNAYGQLVGAHRLMKEKYKLAQQTNREWDHYYRKLSQRSKDEEPAARAEIEPKNISNPTNEQQTALKVLAIPSRKSSSSASGCVPPSTNMCPDTRMSSQLRDLLSGTNLPAKISPRKEALGAQDIFDISPDPEPCNVIETCDESQNELDPGHFLIDRRDDPADQKIKQPAKPADDDSDHPVIVAERPLKRKRDLSFSKREAHGDCTHHCTKIKSIRVKSELDSSSPIAPVSVPGILNPQDSIDLDEVGEKHFTPRKHRRLRDKRQLQAARLRAPAAVDFNGNCLHHGANDQIPKSLQDQNLNSEKLEGTDKPFASDAGSEEDGENDQLFACDKAFFMKQGQEYGARFWEELQRNNTGRLKTAKSIPPKVLKTADPNLQLLQQSGASLIGRSRALSSNRRDRSSALICIFSEDGEEFSSVNDRKLTNSSGAVMTAKQAGTRENPLKTPRATGFHQRLDTLLAEPPPPKVSLASSSSLTELKKSTKEISAVLDTSALRNDSIRLVTPISKHGQVAEKTAGGTKASKPTRTSLRSRAEAKPVPSILTRMHEPKEVLSEYTSLRARPLATLRPIDFKLNPAHNQGYDHPFSEVVHNRDLRKCMPGCKRPGCCGNAIRKAVEIGGYAAPRKCGLFDSSPEGDVEEDERLLEEYLGDNKPHLKGMTAEERQELLLKARTEQFANEHGKHRYVYGRAQSPPGYWDPDMPDTQREKEYRAAAAAYEKEKTADMYKEAMRPDGLYKFRDE